MNETRYSFWRYKQDLEWKISTKMGLEVVFQEDRVLKLGISVARYN